MTTVSERRADPAFDAFGGKTLLINGVWAGAPESFDVLDPATLAVIGSAAEAGPDQARAALAAALSAFDSWRNVPAEERSGIIRRAADGLRAGLDGLATLMSTENGKPLAESRAELLNCARMLEWSAEEGRRAYGRIPGPSAGGPSLVMKVPVGPTYAISPWNFPASMLVRKIGLALASGSTVVAKPSDLTPLIAVAVCRVIEGAGLPPGVLNMLTTRRPAELTDALLADSRLKKITFTGSTPVGLALAAANTGTLRRLSLEMGGHSPAIVLADADVETAAAGIVATKFANAGQSCTAINRLFVHRSLASELTAAIVKKTQALRLGHGTAEETQMGPLINTAALDKVTRHVADAVSKGAEVLTGGKTWEPTQADLTGAFYEPTVLINVDSSMLINSEETFGPVLPIYLYDDLSEVISAANDSEFGLAAYIYGQDLKDLWTVFENLEFGVIGVNDPFPVRPELPFGGFKNSGQEREGGSEGIEAYLETKSVSFRF